MREAGRAPSARLDFLGFATLGLAIGCLQLLLDRGQQLDWFSSGEIRIEAILAGVFFYLFLVQTLTARNPFIRIAIFKDVNFVIGCVFGFFLGVFLFSVLSILPPMLEDELGYPVVTTGLLMAPRGVGTLITMTLVGRIINRMDPRLMIFIGMVLSAVSMKMMSGFTIDMGDQLVVVSGFIQGLGTGLIFVPLTTLAFATLDPSCRNEGSAMYTLIRNMGSSIGISALSAMNIRNASIAHSQLAQHVRPDNPAFQPQIAQLPTPPDVSAWTQAQNAEVTRQATMVSYIDGFWFLFVITLLAMPLILFLRKPRHAGQAVSVYLD